jgi:hypothetical protein
MSGEGLRLLSPSEFLERLKETERQDSSQSRIPSPSSTGLGTLVRAWEQPEPEPLEYIVEQLIPCGYPAALYGDGGTCKSLIALFLAMNVAAGRSFFGLSTNRGPVLYVDAELDEREFLRRAHRIARGAMLENVPEGLHYVQLSGSLTCDETARACMDLIDRVMPVLTIIDSFTAAAFDARPEKANDVAKLMKTVSKFGTSLMIDHIAKPGAGVNQSTYRQYGSVFKGNFSRSTLQVMKDPKSDAFILRPSKTNFDRLGDPIGIKVGFFSDQIAFTRVEVSDDSLAGVREHLPTREQILIQLQEGGASAQEIADELELKLQTVKNNLSGLKDQGRVVNKDGAWFVITDAR